MVKDLNAVYSLSQLSKDLWQGNYDVLAVSLEKNGTRIAALQQEMHGNNSKSPMTQDAIEKFVENQGFKFAGKSWTRFDILVVSFLQYCRDVNPWSIWDSCDLIFQMYQDLNNCLVNDSYPLDPLVPLFQEMTEYVIPIAVKLDSNYLIIHTKIHQFQSFISSVISKLFNSIKPSRSSEGVAVKSGDMTEFPEKQKILLYLVNKLNNIYFRIGSPQLCFNVFKNFKPKSMINKFSEYPIKERIEYRYLLGRYYLLNGRVTNAFAQLNKAYIYMIALCNTTNVYEVAQVRRNLVRVLRYLVPTGLIIGKIPKFEIIKSIDPRLADAYHDLARSLKSGNIKGMNDWLQQHESELRSKHLLLILLEKLPMICYRNLLGVIIRQYIIPKKSGKIPYALVQEALELSIGDGGILDTAKIDIYNGIHHSQNVENVLVTLINLGFLRGNCFPQLKLCVVKKTPMLREILPPLQDKILSSFTLNDDDSWLDE